VDAGLRQELLINRLTASVRYRWFARGLLSHLSELSGESHCLPASHHRGKVKDRESMSEKSAARGSVTAILSQIESRHDDSLLQVMGCGARRTRRVQARADSGDQEQ